MNIDYMNGITEQLVEDMKEMSIPKWKNVKDEEPNKDKILLIIQLEYDYPLVVYFDKPMGKWTDNDTALEFEWYLDINLEKLPNNLIWNNEVFTDCMYCRIKPKN